VWRARGRAWATDFLLDRLDMSMTRPLAVALLLLAALPAFAGALTSTQILNQFNAVVSNDFSTSSDVEGRLATTNLLRGATFYNSPRGAASDYAAINAVNIGSVNGNVNNGGGINYQASNAGRFNMNGGGKIAQTPAFAMTDFTTPLDLLASQLYGMAANSTINAADPNNFTFHVNGGTNSTAVFNLTTAQLSRAANINFSGRADTIIINISGDIFNSNANFNDNSNLKSNIIWNFIDADSLQFRGWNGAVLAGGANVASGSQMQGFLYAKNFTGNGELHDYRFAGTLPPADVPPSGKVPEPSSIALLGAGMVALLARRRRRDGELA
jgi:choice-of-anchor A domain-containing protein